MTERPTETPLTDAQLAEIGARDEGGPSLIFLWAAERDALVRELQQRRADDATFIVIPPADGPQPELAMDADGYPTEETLAAIRHWPYRGIAALLDEVKRIWHWGYGIGELSAAEREFVRAEGGGRYLRLATGGWSGNESIISAMKANVFVRHRLMASARGGLYIFEYPEEPRP